MIKVFCNVSTHQYNQLQNWMEIPYLTKVIGHPPGNKLIKTKENALLFHVLKVNVLTLTGEVT